MKVEVQGVVILVVVEVIQEVIVILDRKVGVTQIQKGDDRSHRRDEDDIHRKIESLRQEEGQLTVGNPRPEEILHQGGIRQEGRGMLILQEEMQGVNPRLGRDIRRMNHRLLDVLVILRKGDAIHHCVEVPLHGDVSMAMLPFAAIGLLHVVIGMNLRLVEGIHLSLDEMIALSLVVGLPHLDVVILQDNQDEIVLPLAGKQIIRIQRIARAGVRVSIVEIRTRVDSHSRIHVNVDHCFT